MLQILENPIVDIFLIINIIIFVLHIKDFGPFSQKKFQHLIDTTNNKKHDEV